MEPVERAQDLSGLDAASVLPMIQGLSRLHDFVALLDGRGRAVWLSDALTSVCGDLGGRDGRCWTTLLDEPALAEPLAERLRETGRVSNEPVVLRGPTGRGVPARVSAARLGPPTGCGATVAIFRTDGESERLDQELRARLDMMGAILASAPEGVVVVDRSRFISWANPAMTELTGYPVEELIDRPLALFLRSQEDVDRIAAALRPDSTVRNQDLEVRRREGGTIVVSVSASLVRLGDGTPLGAVAYLRDVTERRRFEERLAHKNAELEHYVHAVSHDLRSPLVALLGFSRLLREDFADELGDKGGHYLRRIEEAGRTMEGLIQDLLELSRIGRSSPSKEWVEPVEVLRQLQAELKARLEARGVSLELPEAPPMVLCDRTRLYQVLSNLVGNALDHMGDPADPRIEVAIEEVAGGHEIRVCDNGRGIPPEDQERIFEIFQSLSRRRDGGNGNGIGLAVVKQIAESHGGRVGVESRPGCGASFRVFLPAP